MLPELRMFQEMMENILTDLEQPVIKGSERPLRRLLNASRVRNATTQSLGTHTHNSTRQSLIRLNKKRG